VRRHARAWAKVNLTLHVTGRRSDGYHLLDSLVVFADFGDALVLEPADGPPTLRVSGTFGEAAGPDPDNLVLKAAHALAARVPGLRSGAFTLDKRIPVAAGLGGGSADAAAALRLVADANGLSRTDPRLADAALATGADVPVCLMSRPSMMRGIGEVVEPVELASLDAVLVNPRVAVPTAAVFRELDLPLGAGRDAPPHPPTRGLVATRDVIALLRGARNDLEAAACRIAPVIGDVIASLGDAGCALVRMSGSGATVVGLTSDAAAAHAIADKLSKRHPDWWVKPVRLGPGLDPAAEPGH
jgi:4-diphosphocytidyl-2-C-methyl-D-erythritol kinase